ncbi:MAG: type II secretion system major pseudopilin GspG [Fuerstiella sp.]|nr:type II secretion system major pseudopilin GspG [Fuerstiella sp.]
MKHRTFVQRHHARTGFTLIELLIVLAIIVAIAAMVAPNLIGRQQESRINLTKAQIKSVENALKQKAIDNQGTFPDSNDAIKALSQPSEDDSGREHAPYLEEYPRDSWGNDFHYEYDANRDLTKPRIWSSGPDGKDDGGSGDDIANWSSENNS